MLGLGLGVPKRKKIGSGAAAFSDKSLLIDGVDELVTAGDVTSFDAGDVFSVSAWVNFTTTSGGTVIGKMLSAGSFRGWAFIVTSGSVRFQILESLTKRKTIDTNLTFNDGNWHHVVCTKSTGATINDLKIYVDGIEQSVTAVVDTGVITTITNTESLNIGAIGSSGSYTTYYGGFVDEVLIFNAELTQANIDGLYNAGCPKNESATANVVSYWRMGDGSGDNWNVDTANEWTFADQVGANTMTTVNCEESDVVGNTACNPAYSNSSLYLDGTNEYVNTDSLVASLSATTVGAISMWIKLIDATPLANEFLICFGDTDATEYLAISQRTTGETRVICKDVLVNEWTMETNSQILQDNVWHHVVLVQDGVAPIIYIDGIEYSVSAGTANYVVAPSDATAWFSGLNGIDNGRIAAININSSGDTNFTNGFFDEITFWNVAKSAADILDIYNGGCPKDESGGTGLVSYYRMGDGTGDNWNTSVVNEWEFIDQEGANDIFTANCEQFDVVDEAPCTPRYTARSLIIDGLAEYVNINSLALDTQTDTVGTISFWWRPKATIPASSESMVAWSDTDGDTALSMFHLQTTGKVRTNVRVAGTKDWELDTDVNPFLVDVWYHVAFVHDGVEPKIYIDGVAVAQTFTVSTDKTFWLNDFAGAIDNATIGCRNYNSAGAANFANANVVNFMYVRRALTEAQVQDIWNAGCPKDESEIANGVSLYRMGNSTDDNFNDAVAGEWQFVDQIGTNNAQTVDCELDSVVTSSPC